MQLREERQRECESVERGRRARRGRERSEFLSTDETSERRAESAPRGDMAGHHTEWGVQNGWCFAFGCRAQNVRKREAARGACGARRNDSPRVAENRVRWCTVRSPRAAHPDPAHTPTHTCLLYMRGGPRGNK